MTEPVVLTREQLFPLLLAQARRVLTPSPRTLTLPACPECSEVPTELLEATDRASLACSVRLAFRPCGHVFTARDADVFEVGQAAEALVRSELDRPAGEREPDISCALLHTDRKGNPIPCPGYAKPGEDPCYVHGLGSPHDAHQRSDGGWCPGLSEPDDGVTEPAPPPTVTEQVRDLERIIQRVREAVSTDRPDIELAAQRRAFRARLCETFGLPNDEAIDVISAARELLDEARNWARHGYEIGQRHCGWSDHGVAPAWLTEDWPPHFDACEHLAQAGEYETALNRVRALPEHPETMDVQHPDPAGYLHGYKVAIADAKRAAVIPARPEEGE